MLKVVIVGTGNVAKHLFDALKASEQVESVQVWGRSSKASEYFDPESLVFEIHQLPEEPTIYIIAVSDDSIVSVSEKLEEKRGLVLHTSGSTPMSVLEKHPNHGVLYPLQTFSRDRSLDFASVPLCIEANTDGNLSTLRTLARSLAEKVYDINSEKRKQVHLAAVFANNFTNHLYHLAHELCEEHQLPFDILTPLIIETAKKIKHRSPYDMQTGPARRGDLSVLQKQQGFLNSQYQREIYKLLSESIKKTYT